jgi:hypothetical protein
MKKSWHPARFKNMELAWMEEEKARQEQKKIDQLRKEREEERQLAEYQRMQEEAGGKKRVDMVDWMYAGPQAGGAMDFTEESEAYLLGRRRIDDLLKGNESKVGNPDITSFSD